MSARVVPLRAPTRRQRPRKRVGRTKRSMVRELAALEAELRPIDVRRILAMVRHVHNAWQRNGGEAGI